MSKSNSTPIVQLSNVGKSYGNFSALKDVSISVRQGEVTCILGDNGAGKSTLISIIAGLHGHDEGVYAVDGNPVHFTSPRQALDLGISAVYQTLAMVPADVDLAEFLPRFGNDHRHLAVSALGCRRDVG